MTSDSVSNADCQGLAPAASRACSIVTVEISAGGSQHSLRRSSGLTMFSEGRPRDSLISLTMALAASSRANAGGLRSAQARGGGGPVDVTDVAGRSSSESA